MTETYNELLYALQKGLPFVERPFEQICETVGVSESEVITFVNDLFREKKARRFGAVFDSRKLGYTSTLCGVSVPEEMLDHVTTSFQNEPGITHCYLRGWSDELSRDLCGAPDHLDFPNLWFTFMAPATTFDREMDRLQDSLLPHRIHTLPAEKRFKIDVVFDTRAKKESTVQSKHAFLSGKSSSAELSSIQKEIVRNVQGTIAIESSPFSTIAESLDLSTQELLSQLQNWKDEKIIRRFPLILHHYKIGFQANGMCLWNIPEEEIAEAGMALASCPEVTHCYQRPPFEGFPYTLYAMIHGNSWDETYVIFERIQKQANLKNGKMLCSLKEFKKTSPVFFHEAEQPR